MFFTRPKNNFFAQNCFFFDPKFVPKSLKLAIQKLRQRIALNKIDRYLLPCLVSMRLFEHNEIVSRDIPKKYGF